jgi:hypothetical protein
MEDMKELDKRNSSTKFYPSVVLEILTPIHFKGHCDFGSIFERGTNF